MKEIDFTFVEYKEAGTYSWTVPKFVKRIYVDLLGAGASGEGFSDNAYVSEAGQESSVNTIKASGGIVKKNPPERVNVFTYEGGDGEDSKLGKGGTVLDTESTGTPDATGSGAGGASFSYYNFSGYGGGEGKYLEDQMLEVTEGQVVTVTIGKGGNPITKDMLDKLEEGDESIFLPGKGSDGYAKIRYMRIIEEETN